MERLTFLNGDEIPCVRNDQCFEEQSEHYCGPAIDRLAAYEDTGLTPERCAEFARADAEGRYIVMRDAEQEGVARLRELAEADKEGRLVVLPPNKVLTNADRMRTATNQQLAKLLYDNQKEICRLMYKNLGFEDELNFSEDYSDILAWLNAPANTGVAKVDDDNG